MLFNVTREEIMELRDQGISMHEAKRMVKLKKLMEAVDDVPDLTTRLILREILTLI